MNGTEHLADDSEKLRNALFECFLIAGRTRGSLNRKITKVCLTALGYDTPAECAVSMARRTGHKTV